MVKLRVDTMNTFEEELLTGFAYVCKVNNIRVWLEALSSKLTKHPQAELFNNVHKRISHRNSDSKNILCYFEVFSI